MQAKVLIYKSWYNF